LELDYACSCHNPQMSNDIARRLHERDPLGNTCNLQAKTLCKLGDVGDGIAIGQAGELVQWEHDLLDERTECRVLPNANYSEHLRVGVSKRQLRPLYESGRAGCL